MTDLKDLAGKLGGAFDGVKDRKPGDKSPDWAVALVDKLRKDPDAKLDAATLAEAAKNVPGDGSIAGGQKSLKTASDIINKEINNQIKEHPEDAERLRSQQKLLGGASIVEKVLENKGNIPGIPKIKLPFGKH